MEDPAVSETDINGLIVYVDRAGVSFTELMEIIRGVLAIKNGREKGRVIVHIDKQINSIQIIEDVIFKR